MKFESGKFYTHGGGRQIAILGEVETYRWGKVFVIEEADKTGHAMTTAEVSQETPDGVWIEIGKEEWMRNFEGSVCDECGQVFQDGDKFVFTSNVIPPE